VSSPGGTTLAALREMDAAGFMKMIADAVDAANRRAGELAT
jgi:pyrroline-5-carboxylate reductase